jgi:hypothetical protein
MALIRKLRTEAIDSEQANSGAVTTVTTNDKTPE